MTGKAFKITVIVLASILITVILALSIFAAVNDYSFKYMMTRFFPGTVENVYKPYKVVEFVSSQGAVTAGEKGFVYILDDKNLTVYNDKGVEKLSVILEYKEPIISGGDNGILIYDKSSGDYLIYKDGEERYSDSLGMTVLGAAMQRNGFCVFILKGGDGFLGSAMVMNEKNEIIATCRYSDRYPVSGCVMAGSERFAITGIMEDNPRVTGIDIYEFYKENPSAGYTKDIMTPLLVGSYETFTAVGSEYAVAVSEKGEEIGAESFNEIVRAISNDHGAFIVDSKSGVDKISFIDNKGNLKWSYPTGVGTDGITAGENHVFYWSGITAACLDGQGKPISMQGGFEEVRGICDAGGGRIAVVTSGSIVFYEYR